MKSRLAGVDDLGNQSEDTSSRVRDLETEVDEILEKLWELDKSWRNNLVFYGIRMTSDGMNEDDQSVMEKVIKDIIHKRMQISREIPILRIKRTWNGPEVRGSKPITVYFERWQDKDEVLRKSKMLKGSNIYVSEDFSKRVKDQRAELQKFMKILRKKKPNSKFLLQYDKLFVDKDTFVFNEVSGKVEMVNESQQTLNEFNNTNVSLVRKKSSGRRRLQKNFSSESSLETLEYPESPQKSPVKTNYNAMSNSAISPVNDTNYVNNHESKNIPNGGTSNEVRRSEEEEDEGLVDYTDNVGSMSPVRRMSAVIPETIPE